MQHQHQLAFGTQGRRRPQPSSSEGSSSGLAQASQQRGRPSGFRSRGRDQSAFSNLQSFLVHTSPCVPVSSTEVAQDSSAEPAPASEDVFRLADVWQSFESWSAFGAEVPLQVSADQEQVTQCYVPYLSALQLFEKAAPQSRDPVPSVPPPSSCFSDDDLIEPLSSNVSTASSSLSTDSDSEDGKLGPSPARLSHGSVLRPIPSDPKKVIFEFYETVGPHLRDPLTSRIEQLSKECPDLVNLDSSSIHPASWVSIAWYPIYSIPSNGQRLSDLGACFLTFHSLALPSRHMGPWQGSVGSQPTPPAVPTHHSAAAFEARRKRALSSLSSSSSSSQGSFCQHVDFLRPFGFMPYKMAGWCWQDRGHLHSLHSTMMAAAAGWVERRGVSHPDMDFFMRRSGFALQPARR
ncbi:hypothetical protein WJX74_010119 [Apatococcus lobatus]|uniref:Uncharacterized protein n=1 Tax=Apatococcus lobatus TaxID=904363 RepID=A0AAW1S3N8_9CHLO